MTTISKDLLKTVLKSYKLDRNGFHGVAHWARVRHNGLLLAKQDSRIDKRVIALFAFIHDSCRHTDGRDLLHGVRARMLVHEIGQARLKLNDTQFNQLKEAVDGHTMVIKHPDPTIGACWDADRLDLWRVGTVPDEQYLNNPASRDLIIGAMNRSQHWVSKGYVVQE